MISQTPPDDEERAAATFSSDPDSKTSSCEPKAEDTETQKRREKVSLMKCPAGTRKVTNKRHIEERRVQISVSRYRAKEDCKKCPSKTLNKEKIFKKGDEVFIVNTFNDDFSSYDETQSYSSKDVWVLVGPTKKIWKRPLKGVLDKLAYDGAYKITAATSMTGYAGEVAKRASERVNQIECCYVTFGEKDGIWFEKAFFHKDDCENYVMDSTRSAVSPFEKEEEALGPEATFIPL